VVRKQWENGGSPLPGHNGIELPEAFVLPYHGVFEDAIRKLMANGAIPYPRRHRDGASYAVWLKGE